MDTFKLLTGSVRGSGHRYGNNQDSFKTGIVGNTYFGLVSDGCGSGKHSEVGSKEGSLFLKLRITELLEEGVDVVDIIDTLFSDLINFIILRAITLFAPDLVKDFIQWMENPKKHDYIDIQSHPKKLFIEAYIREYWLFTVFGFISTPEKTYIFYRGDGAIRINDVCQHYEQNNTPLYPAYHAIWWNTPDEALGIPEFTIIELDTNQISLLIVGTDSWNSHRDLFLELSRYIDYYYERGMYRRIIVWSEDEDFPEESTANDAFSDDTTIVALVRKEDEKVNG